MRSVDLVLQLWIANCNVDFKEAVCDQVCKAGGDFMVTEVSGRGNIVRGVVFRRGAGAAKAP